MKSRCLDCPDLKVTRNLKSCSDKEFWGFTSSQNLKCKVTSDNLRTFSYLQMARKQKLWLFTNFVDSSAPSNSAGKSN